MFSHNFLCGHYCFFFFPSISPLSLFSTHCPFFFPLRSSLCFFSPYVKAPSANESKPVQNLLNILTFKTISVLFSSHFAFILKIFLIFFLKLFPQKCNQSFQHRFHCAFTQLTIIWLQKFFNREFQMSSLRLAEKECGGNFQPIFASRGPVAETCHYKKLPQSVMTRKSRFSWWKISINFVLLRRRKNLVEK